jgi:hypothetical protein
VIELEAQFAGDVPADSLDEVRTELAFSDLRIGTGPSIRVAERLRSEALLAKTPEIADTWATTAQAPIAGAGDPRGEGIARLVVKALSSGSPASVEYVPRATGWLVGTHRLHPKALQVDDQAGGSDLDLSGPHRGGLGAAYLRVVPSRQVREHDPFDPSGGEGDLRDP